MKVLSNILVYVFAFIGFIGLMMVIGIYLFLSASSESKASIVPLEEINEATRYSTNVDDSPLPKSESINVVRVKVLEEYPGSALLEVIYDTDENLPFNNVWVAAEMLEPSGLSAVSRVKPYSVTAGRGRKALITLGISSNEKSSLVVSDRLLIQFYEGGQTPFHEEQYEYERVWCVREFSLTELFRGASPMERVGKYSLQSSRSISRLCLGDI